MCVCVLLQTACEVMILVLCVCVRCRLRLCVCVVCCVVCVDKQQKSMHNHMTKLSSFRVRGGHLWMPVSRVGGRKISGAEDIGLASLGREVRRFGWQFLGRGWGSSGFGLWR